MRSPPLCSPLSHPINQPSFPIRLWSRKDQQKSVFRSSEQERERDCCHRMCLLSRFICYLQWTSIVCLRSKRKNEHPRNPPKSEWPLSLSALFASVKFTLRHKHKKANTNVFSLSLVTLENEPEVFTGGGYSHSQVVNIHNYSLTH